MLATRSQNFVRSAANVRLPFFREKIIILYCFMVVRHCQKQTTKTLLPLLHYARRTWLRIPPSFKATFFYAKLNSALKAAGTEFLHDQELFCFNGKLSTVDGLVRYLHNGNNWTLASSKTVLLLDMATKECYSITILWVCLPPFHRAVTIRYGFSTQQ